MTAMGLPGRRHNKAGERLHQAMRTSGSTSVAQRILYFRAPAGSVAFLNNSLGLPLDSVVQPRDAVMPVGVPRDWSWNQPGADREARLALTLEEAAHGGEREISLSGPTTGQTKTYMVRIPKGVRPGQRIRLAGQGEPGIGNAPPGDLYLSVELLPHPTFRLEGRDLYTTVPVTPWEAALGAEVTLPTLERAVHVKIPAGSSSGRKIRLKGKGFPDARSGAGDLYAEISIRVPEVLSVEEKKLFEQLAQVSKFAPRPTRYERK